MSMKMHIFQSVLGVRGEKGVRGERVNEENRVKEENRVEKVRGVVGQAEEGEQKRGWGKGGEG